MEENEFREVARRYKDDLKEEDIEQIVEARPWEDGERLDTDLLNEDEGGPPKESTDMRLKLSNMSMPEKMKAAMFGNSIVRNILIYDPNKLIQDMVLRNPRLLLPEVEGFTKNSNISEHVLRMISGAKEWMRYYPIKLNITCNPKTPNDISLKWLRYLTGADLKKLSRSKNIPQLIATTAQKLVAAQEGK